MPSSLELKISNRRRVMVTGGAGFLSSQLCEKLPGNGCDVLCVDNFCSGNKDNIAHVLSNPYFEQIRHSLHRVEASTRDFSEHFVAALQERLSW